MTNETTAALPRYAHIRDLVGYRFGRLVVVALGPRAAHPCGQTPRTWQCKCDCGSVLNVRVGQLRSGHTGSCGCQRRETVGALRRSHGASATPEFRAWARMIDRCENPVGPNAPLYHARGITVCERWRHDFAAFLADMGPRPSSRHSIDRINSDGNYEPSNCRWALPVVQANNTSRNVKLTHGGETMSAGQWADRLGLKRSTVYARVARGWSVDRVLSNEG